MNRYLVETSDRTRDTAGLHVFDDAELTDYLRRAVTEHHHGGVDLAAHRIWHYLGQGKLRELWIRFLAEYHDGEGHIDKSYDLVPARRHRRGDDASLTEISVTVRLNHRA
jgi:hypothetical protein